MRDRSRIIECKKNRYIRRRARLNRIYEKYLASAREKVGFFEIIEEEDFCEELMTEQMLRYGIGMGDCVCDEKYDEVKFHWLDHEFCWFLVCGVSIAISIEAVTRITRRSSFGILTGMLVSVALQLIKVGLFENVIEKRRNLKRAAECQAILEAIKNERLKLTY